MRFCTWTVRSQYRAGSLMTVARELSEYVRFSGSTEYRSDETGGTESAGEYTYFYVKGNKNHELGLRVESVTGWRPHAT